MYEWDTNKSVETLLRRGFGFEIIEGFQWEYALCVETQDHDGEEREKWIGPIEEALYVAVMTERGENVRVISLRRATQTEINFWRRQYANE